MSIYPYIYIFVCLSFCPLALQFFPKGLILSVSVHFSPFLSVYVCFFPFQSVSVSFGSFLSVSFRFCTFLFVSLCFYPFPSVSVRLSPFLSVWVFLVSALLSAHIERFRVSRMQDFNNRLIGKTIC